MENHYFTIKLKYHKDTYIFGRGETSIFIPDKIIVNDKVLDITEWCDIENYLQKKKQCKYGFKINKLISNFIKGIRGERKDDRKRNDVCIYQTILYPPGSKSPNIN